MSRQFSFPYRGEIQSLMGIGDQLSFVTRHAEGLPTSLYSVDIARGELQETALAAPAIAAVELDGSFYVACSDQTVYTVAGGKVDTCYSAKADIVALSGTGEQLLVLTANTIALVEPKSGKAKETLAHEDTLTAVAISPDANWLVAGTDTGVLHVFTCEERKKFEHSSSGKVHDAPVTHLLFDEQELMVISTGRDKRLMMTHVRGELEIAERSKKVHDDAITSLIRGPEGCFYTGSTDKTFKCWTGGYNRKAASTVKAPSVQQLGWWKSGDESLLAIAATSGAISVIAMSGAKQGSPKCSLQSVTQWAVRELESNDSKVRAAAIKKLSEFADKFTVSQLLDCAKSDREASVRQQACSLLVGLDHANARAGLMELLPSKDADVRMTAFNGLLDGEGNKVEVLQQAINTGFAELGQLAIEKLQGLAATDELALGTLIQAMSNSVVELRAAAFASVLQHYAKNEIQAVGVALQSSKADIRKAALVEGFKHGLLQNPSFLRMLRRFKDDSELEVRLTSFALSILTKPDLADVLRGLDEDTQRRLHELDGKAAKKATKAAAGKLSEADRAPLVEAMAAPSLDICLMGAKCLALINDPRAFGVLLQLSRESDSATRLTVSRAFKSLGDSNAIPRLRLMLHDSELNVADSALTSLSALQKDAPLEVIDAGLSAPQDKVRHRTVSLIARQLKASITDEALAHLEKALNDAVESVRREAFKTALNAEVGGERPDTLRYCLKSIHSDIREEVLRELEANRKVDWAQAILAEMLNDGARSIRNECFRLLKQSKDDTNEVYRDALSSVHEDVRLEALSQLLAAKKKDDAILEMINGRLDDESEAVRKSALAGLVECRAMDYLAKALQNEHLDVSVGAAKAQAQSGLQLALEPLLKVLKSTDEDESKEWKLSVREALKGVAALANASAFDDVLCLLQDPKGTFAGDAADALRFVCAAEHKEIVAEELRKADKKIKPKIALALAAIGDDRGVSIIFKNKGSRELAAAYALLSVSCEYLYSFFDEDDVQVRNQAMLVSMLSELALRPDQPAGCLAGLAAEELDARLKAAHALQLYADDKAFAGLVAQLFNERRWGKPWELSEETVCSVAALLTATTGADQLLVLEGLLTALAEDKQKDFEIWWTVVSTRFAKQLETGQKAMKKAKTKATQEELLPLAIGTYVGILRLKETWRTSENRNLALQRLANVSETIPAQRDAVATCLKVALHDRSFSIRKGAFDALSNSCPLDELVSEGIGSGYRDMAGLVLRLYAEKGKKKDVDSLLSQLQQTFANETELEAHEIMAERDGVVAANAAALTARSEQLRRAAVMKLANETEKDDKALKALYKALDADYQDVQLRTALFLAGKQDKKALPRLKALLLDKTNSSDVIETAIRGLKDLRDLAGAEAMLDVLEAEPRHSLAESLIDAIAAAGKEKVADRLLALFKSAPKLRRAIKDALAEISGYTQTIRLEDGKLVVKEDQPEPLHDKVIVELLQVMTDAGEDRLLKGFIDIASLCPSGEIDAQVAALSRFKDSDVRERAIKAAAFRAREYRTTHDTLKEALEHPDAQTKFLAAEGLAEVGSDAGAQVLLTAIDMLPDLNDRQRAVLAIGKLANAQSLTHLLRMAEDNEHALQEAAIQSLGHMKSSDQAHRIFGILKEHATGEQSGLKRSALIGLRWFDSPEAWAVIREQAMIRDYYVQGEVVGLLKYNRCDETREVLESLLKSDYTMYRAAQAAAEALLAICDDKMEAYYVFLESDNQYSIDTVADDYLKEVCAEGEPAKLLNALAKIQDEDVLEKVETSLLNREPLPAKEAVGVLPDAEPRSSNVIFQILGRANHTLPAKQVDELFAASWEAWKKALDDEDGDKREEYNELLKRVAWYAGQCDAIPKSTLDVLTRRDSATQEIRRAVLMAMLDRKVPKDCVAAVQQLGIDGEIELRPAAARVLAQAAPKNTGALLETSLDDATAISQLDSKAALLKDTDLLGKALASGSGIRFAAEDVAGLAACFKKGLDEAIATALLEALGRIRNEAAEAALEKLAKDKKQTEDLRKTAWRVLRRSKRARAKKPSADWKEVTA